MQKLEEKTSWWKSVMNILFPIQCLGCKKEKNHHWLCESCLEKILDEAFFPEQSWFKGGYLDSFLYLYRYNHPMIQSVIHAYKYQFLTDLEITLSRMLCEKKDTILEWKASGIVVPIPLHLRKLRQRGYNQAFFLGVTIASILDVPFDGDVLERKKYTFAQARLSKDEREKNMRNVFRVKREEEDFSKKNYILIDDVLSSGATMNDAARALRNAGAQKVYGFALAG